MKPAIANEPPVSSPPLAATARPLWLGATAALLAVGAYLRVDQIAAQVLIDDEWHAVHQVLQRSPAQMFREFGWADYSIPLGILDWYASRWFGLSETLMRLPMLACGLATLVALPVFVAQRTSKATVALFAALLAISPLLVIYSRMARPYAITLLLGWIAHAAYQRYHTATGGAWGMGVIYALAAALAIWLHPIAAPFALAPLVWGLADLRHARACPRATRFLRLAALALPTGALVAALVLPPVFANPGSLTGKSGVDMPNVATLVGALYAWLGTPSTGVVFVCVALALYGAREVARTFPEARTGALGVVLTAAAVMVARTMWSFNPITFARYLLPFVPLLLLAVATGSTRLAHRLAALPAGRPGFVHSAAGGEMPPGVISLSRRMLFVAAAGVPLAALAATTPLAPMLRHPNLQTLHFAYYFDFRPERNPYVPLLDVIPLSPFWTSLAAHPPGSLRIAAAPFYFESYNWDAPRWERLGRQGVVPALLTGLCVHRRWGEVPRDPNFRFTNAVHLADDAALATRRIDYVVWQKPYPIAGAKDLFGADTAHCEAALREKFGAPAYEDAYLLAFRLSRTPSGEGRAER